MQPYLFRCLKAFLRSLFYPFHMGKGKECNNLIRLYAESYEREFRKKVKKMTVEEILKLREKSLFKRNYPLITLSLLLSFLAFLFLCINGLPEGDWGLLIAILLFSPLLILTDAYQRNPIQDKVIDEILGKRKQK